MASWQAVNVNTGAVEKTKYYQIGQIAEIWVANLTSAWANADVVNGPVIPAGLFVQDVKIDTDQLDTDGSPTAAFEVGYVQSGTTQAAAFIASGNTIARTGGIVSANVAGTVGFSPTADATVQLKFTAGAATAAGGKMRFLVSYTANP